MEIGENVKSQNDPATAARISSSSFHTTQSQPIILESQTSEKEKDANIPKTSKNRRVSFASSSQYLEPINPFESFAVPISTADELSNLYKNSCEKHNTIPISSILEHLKTINLDRSSTDRTEVLNLKQETLSHESCEALEELFKRVRYRSIDLTSCSLDDVSATSLFDMIEYYEACNELNISENSNIKNRGWQSCISMIKRSQALHSLSTRGTILSDSNAGLLGNALLSSYIYTLKLEQCGLSGRPILCLSGALQKNKILKELCLANNDLNSNDAFHIGNILKNNYHLQLLDISNNDIQDEGYKHIAEALSYQSVHVSKTSSADSLSLSSSSLQKFDFNDFTTNLNNINNNRNRFSPTPPPVARSRSENSSTLNSSNNNNNNNNNNNSILMQCDNDKPNAIESRKDDQQENKDEGEIVNEGAAISTKSSSTFGQINKATVVATANANKFKYTTESLSPISSYGYDDTTTNHQLFNSRSPERSFSSESLCSETSVESNDSKSSIRLIESKFNNKNGTLERHHNHNHNNLESSTLISCTEKPPTGLQVLIIWNNNLTSACAANTADLFECTEYLQIINFGQNPIGNEFLFDIKAALKSNESIMSLGLQATNLSCDGLKILAELLQFGGNSTLQRIDLRNNSLSVAGLSALSEALKSNKSLIRIDLDDAPKSDMLPLYEKNSEYQRLISTIRQQCSFNENPIELNEASNVTSAKPSSTAIQRMKKTNFGSRKISLTCSSVKTLPKQQQLLEPIKKQANNRLRSPSPTTTLSPSSPLTSPSRSRFQVSRVSESGSSGISSKSPSSSSSSPTFFPTGSSRFRVITVTEPPKKKSEIIPLKVLELKTEATKEIDIPAPSSKQQQSPTYLDISSSSMVSSESSEKLDYEVKRIIELDSCSSFSSSIDSIDRQTDDVSSTDSFDIVEKSPTAFEISKNDSAEAIEENKKEIFSNENTLTVSTSSSSSSSNEGLTLTTNSPIEMSPKQEPNKRTRKTSWIQSINAIGGGVCSSKNNENISSTYPATLDKLLNLFQHPTSIFTKTSPDSTTVSSPSSSSSNSKPPTVITKSTLVPKDEKQQQQQSSSASMQKENSFTGFIHSLVSLTTHKKDTEKATTSNESSILQNISPENTIVKSTSNSQTILESIPKNIKKELKENISPENTILCDNLTGIEKQKTSSPPLSNSNKVLFVVGDDESAISDEFSNVSIDDSLVCDDLMIFESHTIGDIARDSMTILKKPSNDE
ncbi:hypothetical protein PVAND_008917 [Polypedilum vanderplanki]|uniref:Uncharacterized protein n=1 Tax=Polypedilum vanderplanki TaxID=319348 RepID=A0A9J6CB27_POLVA|nr:hypothetical protein PVAND_008917 [Polypedilum vanderplanki]